MIVDLKHRLIFLRHGETDWNAEGRLQGQRDIPLNAKGVAQSEAAGRTLRRILGREPDVLAAYDFVASPLSRTRRTMELARGAMGLDPFAYRLEPALVEITFGRWEGLTWPQVQAVEPELARAREADKWHMQPPDGESYAMCAERLQPWLATLTQNTIVAGHGGVARCLMHMLCGVAHERAPVCDVWQGRVLVFEAGKYRWI